MPINMPRPTATTTHPDGLTLDEIAELVTAAREAGAHGDARLKVNVVFNLRAFDTSGEGAPIRSAMFKW